MIRPSAGVDFPLADRVIANARLCGADEYSRLRLCREQTLDGSLLYIQGLP